MPNRLVSSIALVSIAALLSATPAHAQTSRLPRWTLAGSLNGLRVGDREGWGYGPELKIRRDFGPHWGATIRASLPVFGGGAGGAAIDAGATYTWASETSELGVAAGGTGFLVGSSSELVGGGIGAFLSVHGTAWLTRHLGVMLETETRFTFHDEAHAYPGVSAGLAVRF
jgi:hypothetical protein